MSHALPSAILLVLALAPRAEAELIASAPTDFTVRHAAPITVSNEKAFDTITGRIDEWWHPDHSWSGDGDNLYFDARLGGCFCEKLPAGGGVEHLRVIYFAPPTEIRMTGALGPLQPMGVLGTMIWAIEDVEQDGAETVRQLVFTYRVQGHVDGGLTQIAPAVDGVIGQQHQRLLELLESQ